MSFKDGPEALAAFPTGTELYSADVGPSILSLNIGGTGTLSEKNGVPAPADAAKAITTGNTGGYQYVYSVDPVAKAAYSWLLASDGSLIYPADETMIGSDVVSIAGRFLYCTNSGSNSISTYAIGTNGIPTASGTANTGSAPTSIVTVGTIK